MLNSIPAMLRDPNAIIGLADAGAHYGMICDGVYPTFLLSYWTRDRARERLGLGEAVAMLTSEPAAAAQLHDRGFLAPGFKADLNVLDYDRLGLAGSKIVYDLPAGGKRIAQETGSYVATIVSGRVTGATTSRPPPCPASVVRGRRPAPSAVAG